MVKPDKLSSLLETHIVEGENQFLQGVSDMWPLLAPAPTEGIAKKWRNVLEFVFEQDSTILSSVERLVIFLILTGILLPIRISLATVRFHFCLLSDREESHFLKVPANLNAS